MHVNNRCERGFGVLKTFFCRCVHVQVFFFCSSGPFLLWSLTLLGPVILCENQKLCPNETNSMPVRVKTKVWIDVRLRLNICICIKVTVRFRVRIWRYWLWRLKNKRAEKKLHSCIWSALSPAATFAHTSQTWSVGSAFLLSLQL